MFSQRSVTNLFFLRVLIALILTGALLITYFVHKDIYIEEKNRLLKVAKYIESQKFSPKTITHLNGELEEFMSMKISSIEKSYFNKFQEEIEQDKKYFFIEKEINDLDYLILFFKCDENKKFIKIVDEFDFTRYILDLLIYLTILITILSIVLIVYSHVFYANGMRPIHILNSTLKRINEKSIRQISKNKLPKEFHLLADTLNNLFNRIDNFIEYQKELFIGTAHELKTPLAVIKLKNQVLLLKSRSKEEYIEAIKLANEKVDEMNNAVSNVLSIGRQESAQFENPIKLDLIDILKSKSEDFKVLANAQNKILITDISPKSYVIEIQETLFIQIIQNLVQNALKFTPKNKKVMIKSYPLFTDSSKSLKIEVIDEGVGIDETIDYFAPFKRNGAESGAGLGLFLAKSASDAMGAQLSLKNRKDGVQGAIASIELQHKVISLIPDKISRKLN